MLAAQESAEIAKKTEQMIEILNQMDYVNSFKAAEKALQADENIWADYKKIKELQQEAVLLQKIGKEKFRQAKTTEAQQIEEKLKENVLVEDYYQKLQNVNDLLDYITNSIQEKVNQGLEENQK